jgi:hypothetical protein
MADRGLRNIESARKRPTKIASISHQTAKGCFSFAAIRRKSKSKTKRRSRLKPAGSPPSPKMSLFSQVDQQSWVFLSHGCSWPSTQDRSSSFGNSVFKKLPWKSALPNFQPQRIYPRCTKALSETDIILPFANPVPRDEKEIVRKTGCFFGEIG